MGVEVVGEKEDQDHHQTALVGEQGELAAVEVVLAGHEGSAPAAAAEHRVPSSDSCSCRAALAGRLRHQYFH